eukprot:78352-Amphidinium_carterae.1
MDRKALQKREAQGPLHQSSFLVLQFTVFLWHRPWMDKVSMLSNMDIADLEQAGLKNDELARRQLSIVDEAQEAGGHETTATPKDLNPREGNFKPSGNLHQPRSQTRPRHLS